MTSKVAEWHYLLKDQKKGPFSRDQISALVDSGVINEHTPIWSESLDEWTPLFRTQLRGLLDDRPIQPPPVPPAPANQSDEEALDALIEDIPVENDANQPNSVISHLGYVNNINKNIKLLNNKPLSSLLIGTMVVAAIINLKFIFNILGADEAQSRLDIVHDALYGDFSVLIGLCIIVTSIIFFVWKYRTMKNAWTVSGSGKITPAGAVYWYFVPVFFLWKPYAAMREIVTAFPIKDMYLLPLWWGAFLFSFVFDLIFVVPLPENISTHEQLNLAVTSLTISAILYSILSFIAVLLISQISELQNSYLENKTN